MWFAWKFVPLWYQQQLNDIKGVTKTCCDLLENSYLCGISNNQLEVYQGRSLLWFAWKFVPLWYQQQHIIIENITLISCDLLENSYLCGISNNFSKKNVIHNSVVICLKIRTFVVSATTNSFHLKYYDLLWFAWKFVPLWYQQQLTTYIIHQCNSCDLLENSYLCGISNNERQKEEKTKQVVICLKIRTFVVSATTAERSLRNIR